VQQASPLLIGKKKIAKKPTGSTLDRCNIRRHKLRKRESIIIIIIIYYMLDEKNEIGCACGAYG